jgi:hypothetical protein
MSMPAQPDAATPSAGRDLRLTLLCVAAPSLWLTLLAVLYALSDRHCERGSGPLWALFGVGMFVCCGLGAASLRAWLEQPASETPVAPNAQRVRFQIALGLLLNLISTLLCIGLAVPLLALRRCQ